MIEEKAAVYAFLSIRLSPEDLQLASGLIAKFAAAADVRGAQRARNAVEREHRIRESIRDAAGPFSMADEFNSIFGRGRR